jgi:hypothetical protein
VGHCLQIAEDLWTEQQAKHHVVLAVRGKGLFMSVLSSSQQEEAPRSGLRLFVQKLSPCQSLALLLIPVSIVEPLKLVAVAVAGSGHWITGAGIVIVAYAASLLVVERLFRMVKPKLLKLPWFARLWVWFISLRRKTFSFFRSEPSS